ncbi:hypothetical protein [Ornithinimicrobium tianjinense]|uniref:Uncharacterized protein n=1 Tax=Ornithinimicrobium tianjinense TaxID=1195761 RepID=A0A917F312_9MICO|nr:hypothetical protein [Ornithinimicrobium tianjinense]GGF47809.1 hypothetical protein GCM10011366_14500 [Ornithinimicrobium tianjinense]
MPDHELPASVRVALWGTAVLRGRLQPEELPARALPDIDECSGLVEQVRLWAQLGERALLVALPRPGDVQGMPHSSPDLVAAATAAEECVFVPGVGGALVPEIAAYGPEGDQGWAVTWTAYVADPFPVHRVEALDLGATELMLRTGLAELTDELASAGAPPFGEAAERGASRARAARDRGAAWGLPDGLPPRAVRVVSLAGTALFLADAGLATVPSSLDASTASRRSLLLRQLQTQAARALADATNAAAVHLAFRS